MNSTEHNETTYRIAPELMEKEFHRILTASGFNEAKASMCAAIFMQNSLEGIYSHGVNRFPRFAKYVREGYIKPDAEPSLLSSFGSIEQWDGNLGAGPLNAVFATDRAMELASVNGIGMATMARTNHWMRGGTYGWHAARKGFVFIGWTNTIANMPAWGAVDPRLGNNPLVFAVPQGAEAIVLDFAMSQFSYGKMETLRSEGKQLPFPGGHNSEGQLTTDPDSILRSWRALPIGYWKGAGLSLLLDILAAVLSGGASVAEISGSKVEYGVSQVFVAIDIRKLTNYRSIDAAISSIIADYKSSLAMPGAEIRYPGENILKTREFNRKNGIPVRTDIWNKILSL